MSGPTPEASPHHARQGHGAFAVGDHEVVALERRRGAVERGEGLARLRTTHADRAAAKRREVERVQWLPGLEQDEVGEVHEAVDAALSEDRETAPPGERRGAVGQALDHGTDVPRTVGLGLHAHREGLAVGFELGSRRELQGAAEQRRELAGEALMPPQVGAVRDGDVGELEDGVLRGHDLADRRAHRRVRRQHEDAVVVVAQAQLVLGADHAAALDPADLARRQRDGPARPTRQRGADRCVGHDLALCHVGRAADDLRRGPVARVHGDEAQAIGIRMRAHGQRARRDDARQGRAHGRDVLDLGGVEGEALGSLGRRDAVQVHQLAKPAPGELHASTPDPNCLRKRRSPPIRWRMSSMPYLRSTRRSMPMPNAKPDHAAGSTPP